MRPLPRLACLCLCAALATVANAAPDDADVPPRARTEVARADALQSAARSLLDRGEVPAAETKALEALDAKRRALGPRHPALGSAFLLLADTQLARAVPGASTALDRATQVPRQEEGLVLRLYTRAHELLAAQPDAQPADRAHAAAMLTLIYSSFGVWPQAHTWATHTMAALGSPQAAAASPYTGAVLHAAAGDGVTNAGSADLLGFFGLAPLRYDLVPYAEAHLAHLEETDAPLLDRARAARTTAALLFGLEARSARARELIDRAIAWYDAAGATDARPHGQQARFLLAVQITDVGDYDAWMKHIEPHAAVLAGMEFEVLKARVATLANELVAYEAAKAADGTQHARTLDAAEALIVKLCSGVIGAEPGHAVWPSPRQTLVLRVAREAHAAAKRADKGRFGRLLGIAHMCCGRFAEARDALEKAQPLLDAAPDPLYRGQGRLTLAYLDCLEGQTSAALEHLEAAWKLRGGEATLVHAPGLRLAVNLATLRTVEGRHADAATLLDKAVTAFLAQPAMRVPFESSRWRFDAIEHALVDLGRHEDLARMTALLPEAPIAASPTSPATLRRYDGDFRGALAIERARLIEFEERHRYTRFAQRSYDWALVRLRQARALLDVGAEDEALADLLETAESFETEGRVGLYRARTPPRRTLLLGYEAIAAALLRRGSLDQARSFGRRAMQLHASFAHASDQSLTPMLEADPEQQMLRDVLERKSAPLAPLESRAPELFARILLAAGEGEAAERVLDDALLALQSHLPEGHPRIAIALHELARVYLARRNEPAAREHAQRALAFLEAALGDKHPEVADVLLTLGDLDLLAARPGPAAAQYTRARTIAKAALDPTHDFHALAASGLALALARGDTPARGVAPMREALDLVAARVEARMTGATNAERLGLLASVHWVLANWLEVSERAAVTGHDEVLALEGRVARAIGEEARILRTATGKARTEADRLQHARRRLARLAHEAPRFGWQRAAWRREIAEVSAEIEKLTRKVASALPALAKSSKAASPGDAALARRLERSEALIDVLLAGGRYVAWVLAPDGTVTRVALGSAATLDAQIQTFRDAVREVESPTDDKLVTAGAALKTSLWTPLAAALPPGLTTLYLVPDGAVAALPFEALPGTEPGQFLIDELTLVRLPLPHALLAPTTKARGTGALLVGDVNFEQAHREGEVAVTGQRKTLLERVPGLRRLPPLPGTAGEIETVAAILAKAGASWRPERLTQERATEGRIRTHAPGKRVVHFATHGIVRDDLTSRLRMPEEDVFRLREGLERHLQAFDPLLMSGLALAGINTRVREDENDGLLTALEVLDVDLTGVDLAFLSACETARGVDQAGEGTLGLVQAFSFAGARCVVASLWPVDDEATAALVTSFYERYAGGKTTAAEALRAASIDLRGSPIGRAPRHWAAFGAYGPLR
ncbi:MAG: CHAT domain-containing protein [Planctomycetota bacterium]|nr:CHAT domain-containing protein [Planctomycetota bacterium]